MKYGAFGVLIMNEWLLQGHESFRSLILEVMELLYGTTSTISCTQYKQRDWHSRIEGGVPADAIMDRIVHNAIWVHMGETNKRQSWSSTSRSRSGINMRQLEV